MQDEKKRYIQETTTKDYVNKLDLLKQNKMAEEADIISTKDLIARQ